MPVMEWKSKTPSEWDWENLADFSGKEIEIPKQVQLSIHDTEGGIDGLSYSFGGTVFSGSALGHGFPSKSSISDPVHSSYEEGIKTSRGVDALAEDFKEMEEVARVGNNGNIPTLGASVGSDEPMIGLKLGKRTYFEDMCASNITKTTYFSEIHASSATTKRSKASYQSMQNPRCQVEGCKVELKSAKDYHRRHKICENHSKSPKVIVEGMERRFCQQCSRFQDLSEFDDKKRSCRRRLSDHNARRRRPQPEAMLSNSTRLSSSLFGVEQQINCLSNGVPVQVLNPVWQSACSFKFTQARDPLVGPAKAWGVGKWPELFTDEMSNGISSQYPHSDRILPLQETIPLVLIHGSEGSTVASNLDVAPDPCRALSLLSSNSWGLNEPEPTSLEQLMHANQTNVAQLMMHAESQNGSLASSEYVHVKQLSSDSQDHLFDLHNNSSGGSQFQEFQLFKAPNESSRFYSRHIN